MGRSATAAASHNRLAAQAGKPHSAIKGYFYSNQGSGQMSLLGTAVACCLVLVLAALSFVVSAVLMPTAHSMIATLFVVGVCAICVIIFRGLSAARKEKSIKQ